MDLIIFVYGLIIGSFLNVIIYRTPLGISIYNPKRSYCPNCNTQIKWSENIPILSYVFLKAKCKHCKIKISIIYPMVELFSAITTLLLYERLGLGLEFVVISLLFYTLIVLAFIDLKYKAVPDYLLLIALILAFSVKDFDFKNSLMFAGGFVILDFFITFYIQNIKAIITKNDELKTQTALGEGDIPIVAIIGGLLSLKLALLAVFLAAIFAIFPALYNSIKKQEIETPFIPFLLLGLFCCYIFDSFILNLLGNIL